MSHPQYGPEFGKHHYAAPVPPPAPPAAPPAPPAPPKSRRWPVVVLAVAAVLFLIFAVSYNSGDGTVSTPLPSGTAPIADPGGLDPDAPAYATFGQRFTWDSGVAIEVKAPTPYKAGQYAAHVEGAREILVETTVFNGSKEEFQFNFMSMGPTATFEGQNLQFVIDVSSKDLQIMPPTTIRPGKSLTYKMAFSIGKEPGELQLEYREVTFGSPAIVVGRV